MIDDPILYWAFDEVSGPTVNDISGNGRDGTIQGSVSRIAGKVGSGAVHTPDTGSSDGVDLAAQMTVGFPVQQYTVAMWVRPGSSGDDGVLFGGPNGSYAFYIDSTDVYHSAGSGNFTSRPHGGLAGAWHHLVVTRSSANVRFYKDGVDLGVPGLLGTPTNTLVLQRLGQYANGTFGIVADFDEVRVYGRELSAADVAELFAFDGSGGTPPPAPSRSLIKTTLRRSLLRRGS